MLDILPYLVIIAAAIGGLILTLYIRRKKNTHESMVCPLNGHCESVINSEYSKFLGVRVEYLGMLYYLALIISYSLFIAFPSLATPLTTFAVLAASTAAVCFSAYLTFIQIFSLKQLCTWCLTSAGLCVVIFLAAILGSEIGFIPVLAQHIEILLVLQMIGVALGVGGITMSSILFMKFLKDARISKWEADVIRTVDQTVWLALAILVISGLSIYLTDMNAYNQSPEFLLTVIVLGVTIITGAVLTLLIAPRLMNKSLEEDHENLHTELKTARRSSIALSAVLLASWYSLLILITLSSVAIGFWPLLMTYIGIVIVAILAGQVIERLMIGESAS